MSWEPFDFGLIEANVDVAEVSRRKAESAIERTRFDVAALTADACLTALAAEQTSAAAVAQILWAHSRGHIVRVLAKAELRPAADVLAERSRACRRY